MIESPENLLNLAAATELCGGKEDIAREIIQMLINELPQQALDLRTALTQQNWHDMDYISHKLAGSTAYCGMEVLKKQARALNNMIRQQQWSNVEIQTDRVLKTINETLTAAAALNISPQGT